MSSMRFLTLAIALLMYLYFMTNSLHFLRSCDVKNNSRSVCTAFKIPSRRLFMSLARSRSASSIYS